MAAPTFELLLIPGLVFGLILGIYEAIVLVKDVQVPTHKFGHAFQALTLTTALTFVSMNVDWVLATFTFLQGIPIISIPIVLRIVVGLIAAVKIHAASRVAKGMGGASGMGETWAHTFIIGILIIGVPYLYPIIQPMLPAFLQ